jgi:iron complex transport system ATP-binding protein
VTGLTISQLRVAFGDTVVLKGVDMGVAPGEWLGLIGPNGAGKTTMLRAIHGTIPSAGSVTFEGRSIAALPGPARARRAAFVPQRPSAPPEMRVLDYVLLGRTPHIPYLAVEGRHDVEVALEALHSLDMWAFSQRRLGELSGGEFQQIVLARALAQEASLLLLDEPTSALDIGNQLQVLGVIDRLRREHSLTIVSAMHDLTLAAQFCDRLVLLADGSIAANGPPPEVLRAPLISRHYGATVRILEDGHGGLVVAPLRQNGRSSTR